MWFNLIAMVTFQCNQIASQLKIVQSNICNHSVQIILIILVLLVLMLGIKMMGTIVINFNNISQTCQSISMRT